MARLINIIVNENEIKKRFKNTIYKIGIMMTNDNNGKKIYHFQVGDSANDKKILDDSFESRYADFLDLVSEFVVCDNDDTNDNITLLPTRIELKNVEGASKDISVHTDGDWAVTIVEIRDDTDGISPPPGGGGTGSVVLGERMIKLKMPQSWTLFNKSGLENTISSFLEYGMIVDWMDVTNPQTSKTYEDKVETYAKNITNILYNRRNPYI